MTFHALIYSTTALHKIAAIVFRSIQGASMRQVVVVANTLFLLVHSTQAFECFRQLTFVVLSDLGFFFSFFSFTFSLRGESEQLRFPLEGTGNRWKTTVGVVYDSSAHVKW